MDRISDFIVSNYVWVLIIALILIFTLIGYLVDLTVPKKKCDKKSKK